MTRLIFVRHGESEANFTASFAGNTDAPLTDLGRAQAAAAGEYLRRFRIDIAYASDLRRAYDTAAIIAKKQGLTPIPAPAFREIFAGEWEGKRFDDLAIEYAAAYDVWRKNIGRARPTGGESVVELGERVSAAMFRLLKEHEGKTVLVGTHATPIRLLECVWREIPFVDASKISWTQNASTTVVEYEGERARIVLRGYNDYLAALTTNMPANV
jgi:broad specificity phosphatase PhoE